VSNDPSKPAAERRQPKQSRSVETWNGILEAAASIYAERGYEQATTHQIAAEAGVSVGALYRYFADKQAILEELYSREVDDVRRRILGEFSLADLVGQDVRQLVRKTISLAFRVYSEHPGLRRVLREQSRKVPALIELRRRQDTELQDAVQQILRGFQQKVRLPDIEVGAYLIALFLESLIDEHVLYRAAEGAFDDERIIDAAADFIMRYVLGRLE